MKMVMVEVSLVSQVARYHLEGVALKPWGPSWGVCMVLTGPCYSTTNPIPHPRSSILSAEKHSHSLSMDVWRGSPP